ncbi:MAG: B12-binding domain-containing radical SAM protein [Candidatus Omnitrophica bacterium]|nr:B12-binding domain-containing radical SAM protein [Candidatus Omnitrophota bacterium]
MKILFIVKELQLIERVGMMYLSAILKKNGHQIKLLRTFKLSFEEICKQIDSFTPQVLAYSTMTGEHKDYIDLNRKLKERFSVFSIFGGPHPTFFPEMICRQGVDCVCIGEGEDAMLELVAKIQYKDEITNIKNLWIKKDGQVFRNPVRNLISNLDMLPFPDRELMNEGNPYMRNYKTKMFFSGRGCPYACTYCFNHQFNKIYENKGSITRFRTVDNLIAEILEVKTKYPLKSVGFGDDTFLLKPKSWLEEFTKKYKNTINLAFSCCVRVDLINESTVRALKDAGCYSVWMGVECGDEKISSNLLKRNIKNNNILNACRLLRKNRIKFATQNLIALPVENPLEVDFKTLELNIRCKPDFAWSSIFYPYPKTDLGEFCRENGYLKKNFEEMAETNKITSELTFENAYVKKKLERLHKIFGIITEFPFLFKFAKFFIRLPLDGFYKFIFFCWYGFCFRIRLEKWKKTPREIYILIVTLLNYLRQLSLSEKSFNSKAKR